MPGPLSSTSTNLAKDSIVRVLDIRFGALRLVAAGHKFVALHETEEDEGDEEADESDLGRQRRVIDQQMPRVALWMLSLNLGYDHHLHCQQQQHALRPHHRGVALCRRLLLPLP